MRFALACVGATLLALAAAACSPPNEREPVVLAAASLQGALDEIADQWAGTGHDRPVISYAGSPAIVRQIEAGAGADVVVLADPEWMDALGRGGKLATGSRRDIVSNALVVVRSEANGSPRANLREALAGDRIAMGDPEAVPAGRYGKAILETLGLWAEVRPKVVPAENVRAALLLVERGEADAAIVYASDAAASTSVAVAARVPQGAHPPIRYPAARLRASPHPEAARFLDYLVSPEAARIFQRRGFEPLPGN